MTAPPVLAIDLGGTKTLAALVAGAEVLESRRAETPRHASADAWLDAIAKLVLDWSSRYPSAGIAVTGSVADGKWWALNPSTLSVPIEFPLVERLSALLGVPVNAANDAQAAAWGEYRHGAGKGRDMVFLTISTGIGGGIVLGGALRKGRNGLAGHIGVVKLETAAGPRMLEEIGSGSALSRLAAESDCLLDPPAIFAAAEARAGWALALIDTVVAPVARVIAGLQLTLDPDIFVIGGGIGLSPLYLVRLQAALDQAVTDYRPNIVAAALGDYAGIIGIADLTQSAGRAREGTR
jgi:predicted NBD/HSP70 family sugar kinase